MKRELKFRLWHKEDKKIMYPDAFFIIAGNEVLKLNPHSEDDVYYQLENCEEKFIIMQYTGLEDKNGKEIFEGDIVKYYHGGQEKDMCAEIFWDWKEAQFKRHTKFKSGAAVTTTLGNYLNKKPIDNHIEVIGNIYENPELI